MSLFGMKKKKQRSVSDKRYTPKFEFNSSRNKYAITVVDKYSQDEEGVILATMPIYLSLDAAKNAYSRMSFE